jgi:hypothetical protein
MLFDEVLRREEGTLALSKGPSRQAFGPFGPLALPSWFWPQETASDTERQQTCLWQAQCQKPCEAASLTSEMAAYMKEGKNEAALHKLMLLPPTPHNQGSMPGKSDTLPITAKHRAYAS